MSGGKTGGPPSGGSGGGTRRRRGSRQQIKPDAGGVARRQRIDRSVQRFVAPAVR